MLREFIVATPCIQKPLGRAVGIGLVNFLCSVVWSKQEKYVTALVEISPLVLYSKRNFLALRNPEKYY